MTDQQLFEIRDREAERMRKRIEGEICGHSGEYLIGLSGRPSTTGRSIRTRNRWAPSGVGHAD